MVGVAAVALAGLQPNPYSAEVLSMTPPSETLGMFPALILQAIGLLVTVDIQLNIVRFQAQSALKALILFGLTVRDKTLLIVVYNTLLNESLY